MKDLLIIFGILLVLLIIISTVGGSIRFMERYESPEEGTEAPAPDAPSQVLPSAPEEPPAGDADKGGEVVEPFDGDAYAGFAAEGRQEPEPEPDA
jgi:hypothetical protein